MTTLILGWLASHWLLVAAVVVAIAALANPVLVWKRKAWILLAVVAWWGWTGHAAYESLQQQVRTDKAELTAQVAAARALSSEAARVEEETRAKAIAVVDRAYQRGLEDGKAVADQLLADRDAGALVLRDKFRCPARGGATPDPGAAGSGDGGEGAVLSRADQDFLVRLAAEADRNTRQLGACQALIRAYTDGQHASRPQ